MFRKIKAVSYIPVNYHEAKNGEAPWDGCSACDTQEKRYRIVDKETGEILDDAQGYGFRTAQKAYACYAYKMRDKSKDKEKSQKEKHIEAWMKAHKGFVRTMDQLAFEISKGSWGPNEKFDAAQVRDMLKNCKLEPDFTPGELLMVWKKRKF